MIWNRYMDLIWMSPHEFSSFSFTLTFCNSVVFLVHLWFIFARELITSSTGTDNHIMYTMRLTVIAASLLASFISCGAHKMLSWPKVFSKVSASTIAALCLTLPVCAEDLSEQLQNIRGARIVEEKARVEREESEAITRELTYPPEKLIARGVLKLVPDGIKTSEYPCGLSDAYTIDPIFGNDDATLFILAVGREGPPLAAKSYQLDKVKFPFVFEVLSEDLLFPYTPAAWLASANHADSIAMSAILSVDNKLSVPNDADRIGVGISEPTVIAGVPCRTSAVIAISAKIDSQLYKPDEIELLAGIDNSISRITK